MAISDKHPEFSNRLPEWIQMEDTYNGERAVKSKRLDYLPATEGMVQDGMQTSTAPGWKDYEAYLLRAYFHDVVKDAVKAMVGIMHSKPADIKVPARMKPMLAKLTAQGEGAQGLLRRINVAQLTKGRCGILVDIPTGKGTDALPYLSFYEPERIINWDAGKIDEGADELELVVIDESGFQRNGFTWKTERKYRVLLRGGSTVLAGGEETRPEVTDAFGVAIQLGKEDMPVIGDFIYPAIAGRTLKQIPFVFIGANDLVPEPEVSPLLGLSNLALAIYRAEADYRQTLYLQGQNTLVIIGGNVDEAAPSQLRVGNKGVLDIRVGGDAKYIGVSAAGLGEMRQSLENDKMRAAQEGVAFLDVNTDTGQSGEALRIRVAARTTTISSVAQAAGLGLENALKFAAEWLGENPDEVSVVPTTDFADQTVAGAALLAFMQAKQLGLPLSLRSMHRMMKLNDMTELDFEQENAQIEEEASSMLGTMVGPQIGAPTDDTFLDDSGSPIADPAAGVPPTPTTPTATPGTTAPPNKNVPVTPHVRGSPVPLKKKVGPKGASAGKK